MDERERIYRQLVETIVKMGYPEGFGLGYLKAAKPKTAEEIADEMLAIMDDRERWIQKKSAEYYNSKYNELLWYGLEEEE